MQNPPFLGILGQKGKFWTVFGQNRQNGFFLKVLGKFLSCLQGLTNCKVSEKIKERFSRNRVTDERTWILKVYRLRQQIKY